MKKVLLTTVLFLAAAVLAGCSDDDPVVPDAPEPVGIDMPRPEASDVTATSFRASWKPVEHAAAYCYALDGGQEKTTSETAALFEGLEAGRTYTLSVQALADDPLYASSETARITVTTLRPEALAAPEPTAEEVTAVSFRASWKPVDHAAAYRYALDGGEEKTTSETFVLFVGLEAGHTYTLSVQAIADDPLHVPSETARITVTTLRPEALAAPVPEAGKCTETSITVVWEAVPNAEAYLCSIDGGEQSQTAELYYTVDGLEAGTAHTVRIVARTQSPLYLDSEAAELTLVTAPETDPFVISASDVTTSSFTATVEPKTPTRTYYVNCMTQEEFDRYASGDEVVASLRRKFDAAALLSGKTYNEYLASQLTSGRQERPYSRLKPGTDYVVYAVGWDAASDLLTTEFATCAVATEEEKAGWVEIAFENVATDGFDIVCTPESPVEKYYLYVTKTNSLTMEQLMAGGLDAFKAEVMPTKEVYSGVQTIAKSGLASGTRYSVCVLAVSAGGATTYKEVSCMTEKPN